MKPESKTSKRAIVARQREAEALRLRLAGLPFRTIAEHIGYRSPASAQKAVRRAMDRLLPTEEAEEMRKLEAERLDALQAHLWSRVTKGDLDALDRVLKIMARRARLLGLDVKGEAPPVADISILLSRATAKEGEQNLDIVAISENILNKALGQRDISAEKEESKD